MVKEEEGMGDLFSDQLSLGGMGSQSNKIGTYTEILKSRRILSLVIEELDLRNQETNELISSGALSKKISVSGGSDTKLMTITVNYPDPELAKEITNTLVEKFKQENRKMNQAALEGANDFIQGQLTEVENKLKTTENNLLEYKEGSGVILPEKQGSVTLDKLTELESAQAKSQIELQQTKASLNQVEKQLSEQEEEVISTRRISDNPVVGQYKKQLASLEVDLAGLKKSYTEQHPQVIEVEEKIEEIKKRLETSVQEVVSSKTKTTNPFYNQLKEKLITANTSIIAIEARLSGYQEQIQEIEGELNSLPAKELKLARLKRDLNVAENVYTMLRERKEEIQIQKAMKTSDVVVVDAAVINEEPIKPNVKLNIVIAAILAIFVGVGVVFVLEFLDDSIKTEKAVEDITDIPVLGVIPYMDDIDHEQGYGRGDDIG
jgi:polysaccharide chain length determinant protein (PEP-CTERM system associated)